MPRLRIVSGLRAGLPALVARAFGAAVIGLVLALPGTAHAADPARSQRLPEGTESQELPDSDDTAKPLPEGEPAGRLPDEDPTAPPSARPAADPEQVVWEAKREGVEDRLRAVRLELDEAREQRAASCPSPEAEGCAALRLRVQRLESQEQALEAYLETGMLAECLRTECDRAWLRGPAAPAD
ncbi:MAG: hypothetical protein R3263_00070 [Myxococcota bacterium]|nr:hypothetical protein [Myxococcota bacterium]